MIVNSGNYDVSKFRGGADDTSSNEADHGFVWELDQESDGSDTALRETRRQLGQETLEPNSYDVSELQMIARAEHEEERASRRADETVNQWTTPDDSADSDDDRQERESARQRLTRIGVDPINYDLEELRTILGCETVDGTSFEPESEAYGFVWTEPPEQHRACIEDPAPEQSRRVLTFAGIDPELVDEKPYLTMLPPETAGAFVMDWLEFLAIEAGTEGAIDAIERYQEIGWFTERVEQDLRNGMLWIDQYDGNGFDMFDQSDHLLSFVYVAKIASIISERTIFY